MKAGLGTFSKVRKTQQCYTGHPVVEKKNNKKNLISDPSPLAECPANNVKKI